MAVVRLFGAARACVGLSQIDVPSTSLADLRNHLTTTYPSIELVLVKCSFLVNEVSQRDMDAPLGEADTVDVLPPFAGGSK